MVLLIMPLNIVKDESVRPCTAVDLTENNFWPGDDLIPFVSTKVFSTFFLARLSGIIVFLTLS
jgi:hypothetical protein